ncbi:asparagine synthase [Streptomyces sp. CT1-17]|uniref:asparagine synthase-related protein n=1 Tax=Streptomyces sp. CT1-17 TaxID=2885642 RepID=UPI001D113667|nr:asparagine synthase-related protein [Streptomyces sp. CT1-17]MCC2268945.1 asparagine synthase [Streptomyces sp. CT1-17]
MEFVVLPDHPAGAEVLASVPSPGLPRPKVLEHHSGRPWLVGDWPDDEIVCVGTGPRRLVLLGCAGVDPGALAARLDRARSPADLDDLARLPAGSFHLVASLDGEVRVQGTLSTACQVFYTRAAGVTVAASRAESLAARAGAGIDEERVALELLSPFGPPAPLSEGSVWRGVRSPRIGHCLEIRRDGTARTRRWWTPPEPERRLGDGDFVREALFDAVAARTAGQPTVSADLSGGLDSTSLCFVAARTPGTDLATLHYEGHGGRGEDLAHARRAAEALPQARHLVVPPTDTPDWYAPFEHTPHDREGPLMFVRARATVEHQAGLVASLGARRHLQGVGGDELFLPGAMCLHGLLRRDPAAALPHIRALRAKRRWSLATTARTMAASPSYRRWLADEADQLDADRSWGSGASWEVPARLPPWITRDAASTVRRLMREAVAADPEPLAALPVQHEMIWINRVNGTVMRRNSSIGAHAGVTFHAPYTDDRVLEAVLSVRLADRVAATRLKPVLARALDGVVPAGILHRTGKDDASPTLYAGLRRRRGELLDLAEDTRLARMGLIDTAELRRLLLATHADTRPLMPFDPTLACELWLRALPAAGATTAAPSSRTP